MYLYALGSNGCGQLGICTTDDTSTPQICAFPDGLELPGVPIKIVAGGNHTLLLLDDGSVYFAGAPRNSQVQSHPALEVQTTFRKLCIPTLGRDKIKLCSASWEDSIFANDKNEVFAAVFGPNGHTASLEMSFIQETLLTTLKGDEIVDLASGIEHTVLVTANGKVYGWGNGRKGQLGEPARFISTPYKIEGLEFPVVRAVCGRQFTYLIGKDGCYTVLGSEKYGIKSHKVTAKEDPKDIAASWGSIFVLTSSAEIESWGRNDHGQLAPANLPPIERMAAGSEHVVALTKEGKVISWGWGEHGNCGDNIDSSGDVKGRWNEILTIGNVVGVGAGCATSFFWTQS